MAMSKLFYSSIITIVKIGSQPFARTKITGLENIPKNGGIIVAPNHISNLDPVLLGVAIAPKRQLKALAKENLFKIPIIGYVVKKMGHIPVLRGSSTASESLKNAVERVKNGEAVVIYPEGTIPANLNTLGAFKSGAARLALETGAPIIPIAQWGAQYALPRHATSKDILKSLLKRPKNTIIVGKPLEHDLLDRIAREKVDPSDATKITLALAEKIEELVEPMRNKEIIEHQRLDSELKEMVGKEVF